MQGGTEFLKLRPGGRQYQRFYQLDQDMDLLHWRPSSKKPEKAMCKYLLRLICDEVYYSSCDHCSKVGRPEFAIH